MKLRPGLHESKDQHLHVSGRHYQLYPTTSGDYKLVPKRGNGPRTSDASGRRRRG